MTQSNIGPLDRQLNDAILGGEALQAFETYYDDDVVMQENDAEPTFGKTANREREQASEKASSSSRLARLHMICAAMFHIATTSMRLNQNG